MSDAVPDGDEPDDLSPYVPYNRTYAIIVARVVDIAIAGVFWRDYGVTISAQCGLAMRRRRPPLWARALNATLNALEKGHCELAIACDIERAKLALRILRQEL